MGKGYRHIGIEQRRAIEHGLSDRIQFQRYVHIYAPGQSSDKKANPMTARAKAVGFSASRVKKADQYVKASEGP